MLERTRRRCLDIRKLRYPKEQSPGEIYERLVRGSGGPKRILLEIGCGREARKLRRVMSAYAYSIGIDLEVAAQCIDGDAWDLIHGDAHALPLRDESVDVIAMADVVEHLEDPGMVFGECRRVLKPGGKVIVHTVNKFFPPIILGRLLPHRLRQMLNRVASGTHEEDTFPTYYRANSRKDLDRLARRAGLRTVTLRHVSHHPSYFLFSVPVYRVAVSLEQVTRRHESLRFLRHMIHAVLERPGVREGTEAAEGWSRGAGLCDI